MFDSRVALRRHGGVRAAADNAVGHRHHGRALALLPAEALRRDDLRGAPARLAGDKARPAAVACAALHDDDVHPVSEQGAMPVLRLSGDTLRRRARRAADSIRAVLREQAGALQ